MTLAKGTMLGPYEVDTLLGAGGMGEVYRARDTRLGRTVAIKVLLSGLTATDERRARFEREARAISALSHPHICALYDIGRDGDTEYLVMEYLEGESLADRIMRGRVPLSQALRFGTEIAQALHAAHRAGITHRDLKPGNVMITSSGVKLLDFGLAKLAEPDRNESNDSGASTMVNPITAEGMVVGTVVYMAPEQLEGKSIDHRTDIFALGCILYEMATGQRPFAGASRAAVTSAILSADPAPIRSLEPSAPPALERIILTALEKNPDDRWQTAQDVARQLRWLSETSSTTEPVSSIKSSHVRRHLLLALLIAAATGALLAWGATRLLTASPSKPTAVHLQFAMPEGVTGLFTPETPNIAISPDGQTLCFGAAQGGEAVLFLRRLDSFEIRKLEGSNGATGPFWSSDGQWIGFSAHGKLWKTKVEGGQAPEALTDTLAPAGAVASWHGHTILFADRAQGRSEIYRISDQGGTPVKVTAPKKGEWRHAWPHFLSDGQHFLYWSSAANSFNREIILASLDTPATSVLLRNVSQVGLIKPDQLIYVRDGELLVQRFDADKGALLGDPALIANDVEYFYASGRAIFDAANGVIVYRTDTSTGRLVEADRKGVTRLIDDHGPFQYLSLSYSNDGKQAAVTVLNRATGLGDIWIYDLSRAVRERLTNDSGLAAMPVWSPDGRSIVYSLAAGALPHLFRRDLTASASEELLPPGTFQFPGSFSPDGKTLFFDQILPQTRSDILRLDMQTRKAEPVVSSPFFENDPQVSPDDKWLAFVSNSTGSSEVYLQSLSAGEMHRVRISTNGGSSPRWRRDTQELFYLSRENAIMSVTPKTTGQWDDTKITELFHQPPDALRFASSPDGQSFLFIVGKPGATDSLFHVILGWQ
ncbi:MAG: eukaryotic-like serine/threonine-protein kinase [Thermoanaerobaculia bacterium]|jgi:serine/threonine protein kinase/Tol biopolymer transport system component|nr:eukaryotic-like serine/threonine-protein kinase [Thermoanaerobaculia bacterium]